MLDQDTKDGLRTQIESSLNTQPTLTALSKRIADAFIEALNNNDGISNEYVKSSAEQFSDFLLKYLAKPRIQEYIADQTIEHDEKFKKFITDAFALRMKQEEKNCSTFQRKQNAAATEIQRIFRGKKAHNAYKAKRDEVKKTLQHAAATEIQRIFRGKKAQNAYKALLIEKEQKDTHKTANVSELHQDTKPPTATSVKRLPLQEQLNQAIGNRVFVDKKLEQITQDFLQAEQKKYLADRSPAHIVSNLSKFLKTTTIAEDIYKDPMSNIYDDFTQNKPIPISYRDIIECANDTMDSKHDFNKLLKSCKPSLKDISQLFAEAVVQKKAYLLEIIFSNMPGSPDAKSKQILKICKMLFVHIVNQYQDATFLPALSAILNNTTLCPTPNKTLLDAINQYKAEFITAQDKQSALTRLAQKIHTRLSSKATYQKPKQPIGRPRRNLSQLHSI